MHTNYYGRSLGDERPCPWGKRSREFISVPILYITQWDIGICLVPFNRWLPCCFCSCRNIYNIQIHGPEEVASVLKNFCCNTMHSDPCFPEFRALLNIVVNILFLNYYCYLAKDMRYMYMFL